MKYSYLFLFTLLFSKNLLALPVQRLMESPKGTLLGGAFTARADDEYTLFYNPAALGRNEGFKLNPLNINISGSNIIDDRDRFENLPDTVEGVTSRLAEYPIHINLGATPSFKMGSFGFNLFANSKTDMLITNALDPEIHINSNNDKGFITGIAFGFGRGQISTDDVPGFRKKRVNGYRMSFGLGVKYIDRTSIRATESLLSPGLYNLITNGNADLKTLKSYFGESRGKGLGVDLGTEYTLTSGRSNFVASLALLDVGDTSFSRKSGTRSIASQKMTLNSGLSWRQDCTLFDLIVSTDIQGLNQNRDFMQKFHFGTELAFPIISLYSGFSEGYLSYGVSAHIFPVKVTAGFNSREFGEKYKSRKSKEFVATVSLFNFSFNL